VALIAKTRSELPAQAPPVSPAVPLAPLPPPKLSLVRDGEIWSVGWDGQEIRLKHSRALEILAGLVEHPGREFHVLALGPPEAGEAVDLGDGGELLDDEARAAYRRRLGELDGEIEEARQWADLGRSDRLAAERAFLAEELARGTGLGGRPRRAGAAVERARVNVQKRLRGLIKKLGEVAPGLGRHLESEIKTGTYVSYGRRT
jgi:hypothetical protein